MKTKPFSLAYILNNMIVEIWYEIREALCICMIGVHSYLYDQHFKMIEGILFNWQFAPPQLFELMSSITLLSQSSHSLPSPHGKENQDPTANKYDLPAQHSKKDKPTPDVVLSPHSIQSASTEDHPNPASPQCSPLQKIEEEGKVGGWDQNMQEEREAIQEEVSQGQIVHSQQDREEGMTSMELQAQEPSQKQVLISNSLASRGRAVIEVLEVVTQQQYSKNRSYLIGWLRKQCLKSKLQYSTYANALTLMDQYYKYTPFHKETFVQTVLCLIIISSKAIEPRVIYTATVAKANGFDLNQTLLLEQQLLAFFEFQVNVYSFTRVVGDYMQRWDKLMFKMGPDVKNYCFLEEGPKSYILCMEVLFLCQNELRHRGSLSQLAIKRIFITVLSKCCLFNLNVLIEQVFAQHNREATQEKLFAYQLTLEDNENGEKMIKEWQNQFQATIPALSSKFTAYLSNKQDYDCYGQFLSLLA